MITWAQWGIQDALSPVIEEFLFFHDFAFIVLSFITAFVSYVIVNSLISTHIALNILEGQIIECIWTLVPAIVLIQVAIPSLILLYILDEGYNAQLTLKVIGHQWYWRYEYTELWGDKPRVDFDSYMIPEANLPSNGLRLLDVDNRTTLPYNVTIRILVSSSDVLHSWAIPRLGVKADASPGRLNQLNFIRYRPGLYFGQCSEICGANHRFIPIRVEFISPIDYFWWSVNK